MKFLNKLNRGAILTAVVLLGVIIYLTSQKIYNDSQVPIIKDIVSKYVETEVRYNMLPEKHRENPKVMTKGEFDSYLNEMKTEISKFYNKEDNKFLIEILEHNLKEQLDNKRVVHNYSKNIEFKDIRFNTNTVKVSFVSDTTYEESNEAIGGKERKISSVKDEVSLIKIDDNWYVYYSNLKSDNGMGGMTYE
ncbi:MAG: hypothetical protein ACRCZK_04385 [Oscillospiraceae bacterium]